MHFNGKVAELIGIILLTVLFLLTSLEDSSRATTITAASVSFEDVSAAISAARSGDTVVVPAGSATWSSPLIITQAITLQDAGAGVTNIKSAITGRDSTDRGLISYEPATPSETNRFRVTGFTLDTDKVSNGVALYNNTTTSETIRVDHNAILNVSYGTYRYRGVIFSGTFYGVVDNNTIISVNTGTGAAWGKTVDSYGLDGRSWTAFESTRAFGTANNIYVEDNTITSGDTFSSTGQGGRYVLRYNAYDASVAIYNLSPTFDAHGNQPSGYGNLITEIYGNSVDYGVKYGSGTFFDQRGGMSLMFFNKVTRTGQGASTGPREECADATYPAANSFLMHVTNSYYWNNRDASDNLLESYISQDTSDGSTVNSPLALLENRDYWQQGPTFDGSATQGCGYPTYPSTCNTGVGCGTLANRPATCTTGVAYWATNQSCTDMTGMVGANPTTPISGTLYKCTAPDTWTAYYTPYTYPHPLRGEAPDTTPPAVPTGLVVR